MNSTAATHVILADDDVDDRDLFRDILNDFSPSVFLTTVDDGLKLMNALSSDPIVPAPHLIFLDINMPLKDGFECLKEIRSNSKFDHVPVFMFSTHESSTVLDKTYYMGANLYIPKFFFFTQQNEVIKRLFEVHWKDYVQKVPRENFLWRT